MHPAISSLRLLCSPLTLKPSTSFGKPPRRLFTVLISSSSQGRRRLLPSHTGANLPFSLKARRGSSSSRPPLVDNMGGGEKHKRTPMEEDIDKKSDGFVFNKKRAEGKDGTMKKNLRLKSRKLNPNTISYVQILGTGMDTQDTSPSVLLFFDKQRFIFNAGEGLQRFCTEHKIKLSKIDHIFLSRVSSETAGGIPGLLLTLAGTGEEGLSVNIWGPSDLNYLVDAMKSFIPHAAMVHTRSFGSNADALPIANEDMDPIVLVEDEVVKISAILLKPKNSKESVIQPGEISVLYLCELPEIAGKFDPEKAKALGLRSGPKYGELQSGKSVMSDSQSIMVHPRDVMDPPVPGPVVLLVDCPTESHLHDLRSKQNLNMYYSDFCHDLPEDAKIVSCIIHLSPVSVSSSPDYQEWMKRFGSAQHIMAGHEKKHLEVPIMMSSARIGARLNYLCPQFFPAPGSWLPKHIASSTESMLLTKDHASEISNSISAENLLKFTLRPHVQLGLDKSKIPNRVMPSEIVDELLQEIPEIVDAARSICKFWRGNGEIKEPVLLQDGREPLLEEKTLPHSLENVERDGLKMDPWLEENTLPLCLDSVRRDDLEIVLLGTGSSQPSKYRNVTSIFINLFTSGGVLLDCGEGTLGQLKRRYGVEGADEVVRNLTCIWISHIHADHHAGLARILALRRDLLKNVAHEPMLVVGPRQLKRFLDAYQRLEDLDMQFIDCWSTSKKSWGALDTGGEATNGSSHPESSTLFAKEGRMQSVWTRPGSPAGQSQALPALKSVLTAAGLDTLISFPVVHCPQAFGVALKAAERTNRAGKVIPGWKIVYSGDTRPCPELVEASRGATVLIHEATFEDALVEEALARNHSTTKEAIEVGEAAGAYRVILTHFSQRYPKVPVLEEAHMHNTCIAFDMMSVNLADLPVLPKVVPYLKLLFRDELVIDESDDVVDIDAALS